MQVIIADSRSQELLEILKRERSLANFTSQDQINSRRSTEKILGPDENLFRIDWVNIIDFYLSELTTDHLHRCRILK